jgi:lysophospholipase L1-like esterase
MTIRRKAFYSAALLAVTFLLIEGTARIIWARLESRALVERQARGEAALRNDAVNYLRVAHPIYGYTLRPNAHAGNIYINAQGFLQRDTVPLPRRPGFLRIACLGESTTFGTDVDINYPSYLRNILQSYGRGFSGYEVINAGVPGWVSDQIALRVEQEIAAFRPDAVVLYAGWNDFQSYDPLAEPPRVSYFEHAYGGTLWKQYATAWLRSVALLSALYHARRAAGDSRAAAGMSAGSPPEKCYRFFLENLRQIAASFRRANPQVKIFVCTLVGRWPQGTPHELAHSAPVWWMQRHNVTGPQQAAALLNNLNDQLRRFARSEGAILVDAAARFDNLDRARLQWDWAHMYPEGYELLAWTIYAALRDNGVVQGQTVPRQAELLARYQLLGGVAAAAR